MARWDKLLSLPVQSPPKFEFSAADLEWAKVEGWADNIEKVAFIPFDRVNNFLNGESANKEFPTRFYVEAKRKGNPLKEKVDGILEFVMYRCAFGPDDRREGGNIRPSRNTYVPKKKPAGRPSIKRGCQCYFFVKRLVAKPSAALIIYKQDKHVDEKGLPCHGPQDAKSVGTRAMFSPYIADDLRLLVTSLIHVGFSVETIMHLRKESIEKQKGPFNHDDLLNHRYVRRLERSIRRSIYDLDDDDALSIELWADKHESDIFYREDYSETGSFILGIQTEWQLQQMIKFSNCSILASHSRFGTNKLKYPVQSLLVFDSDKNAIPVAWIISPQSANVDAYKWIRVLQRRVHSKDPTWKLAGFVVDDPLADVLTIRDVFQCSVLISFWRVRHAWLKNLVKKCLKIETCYEISRRLGEAVYSICIGSGDLSLFEDFVEDFVDCSSFMDYFRASWLPRLGMWITALKTLPYASQETCASMESYHYNLKLMLLTEKNANLYQRSDWLVDKLYKNVHSYFFLDAYPGKEVFARYMKGRWVSGLTSWRRALDIPDSDVTLEGKCAKVISQHVREMAHVVWNPGSEFALCDCNWSGMGNLCKHVIKVSSVCRAEGSMQSISLSKYKQTLINMFHCPPHNSLMHDHAISLAASIQMQLITLLDVERTAKQHLGGSTLIGDAAISIEGERTTENVTNAPSGIGDEVWGGVACDLDGVKEVRASPNGVCGDIAGQSVSLSDMNVNCGSEKANGAIQNGACGDIARQMVLQSDMDANLGGEEAIGVTQNGACGDLAGQIIAPNDMDVDLGGEKAFGVMQNGVCEDIAGQMAAHNDMDVDPVSLCASPARLLPFDDILSSNVNEESQLLDVGLGMNEHLSSSNNVFIVRDSVLNEDNDFCEGVISKSVCGDVIEGVLSRSMMDVDPKSIQLPMFQCEIH